MVFFGSFSSHVHITLRVNIFCPQKNTSIVTTLTHFFVLHCHLSLRVPTSEMVISCKPGKCVLSCERERSFPETPQTQGEGESSHICPLAEALLSVRKSLHMDAGLVTSRSDALGGRHTQHNRWGSRLLWCAQGKRRWGPHRAGGSPGTLL